MSSREQFEAWMTAEQWFHGSDFEWDERRNCYSQFGIHLAYKAWVAATKQSEDKCAALAAEVKQSQIDAGCYKHGMEASNARLVQVAAESAALKEYLAPVGLSVEGTQDTDTFLAEVRAQGVEMFAKEMHADISEADAIEFAAKLRQEAAQ